MGENAGAAARASRRRPEWPNDRAQIDDRIHVDARAALDLDLLLGRVAGRLVRTLSLRTTRLAIAPTAA
jgi:hypothetical protein